MSRLKLPVAVLMTFVLTSLFWIAAFNGAAPSSQPGTETASSVAASATPPSREEIRDALRGRDLSSGDSRLETRPGGLIIPVIGVRARQLTDTYTASRSGGRVHNAIDIMAPRGSPVVAAAPGTVERLHYSNLGGITAYVRSDDGQWVYYYAHLDAYAPGLAVGQRLAQGDAIGFVGFTGNASPAGPHLHFGVYRMTAGQRWYQGTPVNPFPILAGR